MSGEHPFWPESMGTPPEPRFWPVDDNTDPEPDEADPYAEPGTEVDPLEDLEATDPDEDTETL